MTRLEEARERVMEALDTWYEHRNVCIDRARCDTVEELVDAYAALKRAENGEPEDD